MPGLQGTGEIHHGPNRICSADYVITFPEGSVSRWWAYLTARGRGPNLYNRYRHTSLTLKLEDPYIARRKDGSELIITELPFRVMGFDPVTLDYRVKASGRPK